MAPKASPPATPSAPPRVAGTAPPAAIPASRVAPPAARAGEAPASPVLEDGPAGFRARAERLARDAASGADPDLRDHADLLAAIAGRSGDAARETRIEVQRDLAAAARERVGRGTGWATLTTYVEAGGDADALRRVYLDYDRLHEWTGRRGTRVTGREGSDVLAYTDGVRTAMGVRYGARWSYRARSIDRGTARLIVTTQVEADGTEGMLTTRGVALFAPEAGGVRVAEAAASVVDFEVPSVLRGMAEGTALRELRARTDGFRTHWREYVR